MKNPSGSAPIAKGLACARCKARKTRCSGEQPCSACVRSARFKHRPVEQVFCVYGETDASPPSLHGSEYKSRKIPRIEQNEASNPTPALNLSLPNPPSLAPNNLLQPVQADMFSLASRPSLLSLPSSNSSFGSFGADSFQSSAAGSFYETDASSIYSAGSTSKLNECSTRYSNLSISTLAQHSSYPPLEFIPTQTGPIPRPPPYPLQHTRQQSHTTSLAPHNTFPRTAAYQNKFPTASLPNFTEPSNLMISSSFGPTLASRRRNAPKSIQLPQRSQTTSAKNTITDTNPTSSAELPFSAPPNLTQFPQQSLPPPVPAFQPAVAPTTFRQAVQQADFNLSTPGGTVGAALSNFYRSSPDLSVGYLDLATPIREMNFYLENLATNHQINESNKEDFQLPFLAETAQTQSDQASAFSPWPSYKNSLGW